MGLHEKLTEDMKTAMRAREAARLSTIRMLIAALKNERIERGRDPTEDEEIAFLSTQAKRRQESITAFDAAGRTEMADTERAELAVIQTYLPAQLSADEVRGIIAEVIAELGATSKKDMGRVMGALMPRVRGRFPGGEVKGLVDAALP
jgi:uncharacterized protein YqeY